MKDGSLSVIPVTPLYVSKDITSDLNMYKLYRRQLRFFVVVTEITDSFVIYFNKFL